MTTLLSRPLREEKLCSTSLRGSSNVEFVSLLHLLLYLLYPLGPTLIFNVYASWSCIRLQKEPVKVRGNYRGLFKLITTLVLVLLQLILLVLEIQAGSNAVYIWTAAGDFIGSMAIPHLSFLNHSRTISPFDSLSMLLITSLCVDLAQTGALHLTTGLRCQTSGFNVSLLLVKSVLLILELKSKRSILRKHWQTASPEETESIFNQTFYWWMNSLLRRGHCEILTSDDLLPLPKTLSSSILRKKMKGCWESRSKPEGRYALVLATLRCTLRENLCIIPYMLGAVCLRYAQPVLISHLIRYVSDSSTSDTARVEGFKLLFATIFIYIGSAVSNGHRDAAKRRAMTAVKGSLIGIIHEKSLQCSDNDHSAISLINNDVEQVHMAMGWAHLIWSSLLSISLGLYLLASKLGWVSVIPIILVLLSAQGGKYASKLFIGKHRAWRDATEVRVSLTKTLLEHLKVIKMMGYSHSMKFKVQETRENELRAGMGTYWLDVILAASGSFLNVVTPAITLGLWSIFAKLTGDVTLDANQIFTSFALIQMVTLPATSIMFILPEFITSVGSFERIQRFLLHRDHQDNRKLPEGQIEHFLNYIYTDQDNHRDMPVGSINSDDVYAIKVEFATVRYNNADQPVLKNINLKIVPGWLVLVAGMTGSGKTTLARTMLGQTTLISGSVSTSSDNIAFCAQSPWLREGSIRDIIAGPPGSRVTDEKWYQRVLHACDLQIDLLQLPDGDDTLIGARGISLSVGQRQLLALARAVYSQLDILILDDPLSSLDGQTTHRVMQRLLGPAGLLRELNKTVVLVTDPGDLLQNSDLIVVLNRDGSICEQGKWDEPKIQACYNKLDLETDVGSINGRDKRAKHIHITPLNSSNTERSIDQLQNSTDTTIYTHYLRAIGGYRSVVIILIFFFSAAFATLVQIWLRTWADDEERGKRAIFYPYVYFALAFGHWVSLTVMGTIEFIVVPTSGRTLHDKLLTTVIEARSSFITSTDIETTLVSFSQDMQQIDRKLPREMAVLGSQAFKLLSQIILLCMSQTYNLITVPILAIVLYVIQRVYLATSRQIRALSLQASSIPTNSRVFVETIQGIATIRAFGWEAAYAVDNSRSLDASQAPSYTLHAVERWLTLVVDLIVAGVALVNVSFIITFPGSMTAGDVGISMNVILMGNMILMITVQSWANFDASLNAISCMRHFATTVAPESRPAQEHPIPDSWGSGGEIDMNNVVANYARTSYQTFGPDHALNGISFKVEPGQKIGLCGPTDSGKTSLLLSFLRMIDVSKGTIIIDGLDLSSIPRDLIRSRIITIPQDSFIISSDSVRQNLDVMGIASDKTIITTLKKVNLWAFLQSRATDAGLSPTFYLDVPMIAWPLSQGQLRLFSLARALLLRSSRGKIVLIDEAASNIDSETSGLVQQVIREEFQGYTIIMVANDLESLADSDSIILMEKGRIVEVGSFDSLRQNQGPFASLVGTDSDSSGLKAANLDQ